MTKKKPPELHLKSGRKPIPPEQRHRWTLGEIMQRCDAAENECWEWRLPNGEPPAIELTRRFVTVRQGGVPILLRRLAWELYHGVPPDADKLIVMDECRNPRCNNPAHAKEMTCKQKSVRAAKLGALKGLKRRANIAKARRINSVINIEIARKIRADNRSGRVAAKDYGISPSMFNNIRSGRAWKEYEANPFGGLMAA